MGHKMSEKTKAAIRAGRLAAIRPVGERFYSKVNKGGPNGCHLWTGAIGADGYARFLFNGKVKHAHRVAMILAGHEVPDTMDVDHCVCRIRHCVNPAHLRVVSKYINGVENNDSPLAKNAQKTHCKWGHEFTPENTRIVTVKNPKNRHGNVRGPKKTRLCLACYGPGGIRKTKAGREKSNQY